MQEAWAKLFMASVALALPASASFAANEGPAARERQVQTSKGVAGLPYARGRSFRTLDEYLAYLEQFNAPIDLPWWRRVKPELYERVVRMPGAERETATRRDLMRRFGFEGTRKRG